MRRSRRSAPCSPHGARVNRRTASGRLPGTDQRGLGVADALRTEFALGAAYTLKLDGELGSIECGKRADFAVLERTTTLEIGAERLEDVRVWARSRAAPPSSRPRPPPDGPRAVSRSSAGTSAPASTTLVNHLPAQRQRPARRSPRR
jgi:hypothetical protein